MSKCRTFGSGAQSIVLIQRPVIAAISAEENGLLGNRKPRIPENQKQRTPRDEMKEYQTNYSSHYDRSDEDSGKKSSPAYS